MTGPGIPSPGDMVRIDPVSLIGGGQTLRVIGHDTSPSTPDGWIHLDGYLIVENRAVNRRSVFVLIDHLTVLTPPARRTPVAPRLVRAARNTGPGLIPRPRTSPEPMTGRRSR